MSRRLAAIMFTDIAGYTPLAHADEAAALQLLKDQEVLFKPILGVHGGRKVKSTGDGLLIEFSNALDAVECGVDLQRQTHERNSRAGATPLRVRVGIHLGDVQGVEADIFGDAVNIASRIEPLAEPGGVCLSEPVFTAIRNKLPYQIEKIGPKNLKGVREPLDVYRVVLPWIDGEPGAKGPSLPRIAVLPFANISPDPQDEYFADGLTEELITVLSQIKGLRVISRTSVNQYRGTTKPVVQIGSEIGADSVLEGSVRKAGDQLRISVQLIDTKTDEHRWAQAYDRKFENIFAIQAEVAERTAGALKVELLSSEREAIHERPTSSLAAYESYLRGMEAFRRYRGWGDLATDQEAVRFLEAAIREDPEFSAAYSYLANHLLAVMGITRSARETVPRARDLAARALELNPKSSDAHVAQGNALFQGDLKWAAAEAEFQQAIALNPSSSTARFWYGYLLWPLQRFDESNKQYLAAIELDPLWLLPRLNRIGNYAISGKLSSAVTMLEALRESFGADVRVRQYLAECYALEGRADEALNLIADEREGSDLAARTTRAVVLAALGRLEEARAWVRDYERGALPGYLPRSGPAGFYALLGEAEKALALLEADLQQGDRIFWGAYQAWFFDSIRDEPRFVSLIRAMDLPRTLSRPRWTPPDWAAKQPVPKTREPPSSPG